MAKATPLAELQELHRLVAKSLNQRISLDIEDNIPTDAATLGAAIKFLKDNAVTADPADADDLSDLRNKLKEQAAARRAKGESIVALATSDLKLMEA
jgi:hypothetical protein